MTQEFYIWIEQQDANYKAGNTDIRPYYDHTFNDLPWDMQWGVYQKFFWETKGWWLSTYPYTDKFGGKIRGFWGEAHLTRDYITNVPEQAQRSLVEDAFKRIEKD